MLNMVGYGGRGSGVRPQIPKLCVLRRYSLGGTSIGGVATWGDSW